MKNTELRIGNLFKDKHNKIIKVIGLCENDIYFSGSFELNWQAEPIPLTEQWLLDFGFKWKNHGLRIENICIRQFGFGYAIFLSNESYNFKIELKHVHQLQNLYYALTGQELTLNSEAER